VPPGAANGYRDRLVGYPARRRTNDVHS
jgi:hypothetical protein